MLLYLDNAQLAWLEGRSAGEQQAFADGLASTGAEVVLSPLHLQEIGQLTAVHDRLEVLRVLAPRWLARSTYDVFRHEIALSLLRLSSREAVPSAVRASDLLLPLDFDELAETVRSRKHVFEAMRSAFELSAEAEAMTKAAPTPPSRVAPPTEAQIKDQLDHVRELILSHLPEGSSMRAAIETALPEIGKMHLSGMKSLDVMRHALGVERMTEIRRAPKDDLSAISVMRTLALRLCGEMGGGDRCEDLVARFDPYSCPGFRLRAAVHRARLSHPKLPEPGDQIDEEHLVYGPYVDRMFVDKRTWTFANQEARRSHGLLRPEDTVALVQARDLTDVLRVARSTPGVAGGAS